MSMDSMVTKTGRTHGVYLYTGMAFFASALVYYVIYRAQLPWPGYLLNLEWAHLGQLTDHTRGSYPSFAFALSLGLISIALFAHDRRQTLLAIAGIWLVGIIHETSMGTFDRVDIFAGSVGALIALGFAGLALRVTAGKSIESTGGSKNVNRIKLASLLMVSATFATGTSEYENPDNSHCVETDVNGVCVDRITRASPVYMSYADLRSAVKITEPRALTSVARIYLYKNFLFANEMNEGIHIIDNTVPTSPERIGFIEIPGNTEISIREDNLYADSYIDLVTIDVSDVNNITEIARQQDIFPYNSRQNIPGDVTLTGQIDRDLGVVVGYR